MTNWKMTLKLIVIFAILSSNIALDSTIYLEVKALTTYEWKSIAEAAWRYFQPGIGVHIGTGVDRAKLDWFAVTDWDTAGYILAIIDAHRLGLIEKSGTWGFDYRVDKILSYLENRVLGTKNSVANYPYWAYHWDGSGYITPYTDWSDSGKLLLALDQLRDYDSSFSTRVQNIFLRCKTAYDVMATQVPVTYYGYLVAHGFQAFGYDMSSVIGGFESWVGPWVTVEGQTLPLMITIAEPMVQGILEAGFGGQFAEFSRRAYEAQKARSRAWSEGGYYQPPIGYIYEWIVSGGQLWVITDWYGNTLSIPRPLSYTKIAFAYLAIYGENPYTTALYNAVRTLKHAQYGFGEAVYDDDKSSAITLWGSNTLGFYSDKTNQIVLAAARYAIYKALPSGKGTTTVLLDASPKPGYVNKPVTISGVLYGSWRCIRDGMVVGKPVEISTGWGFTATLTTDYYGRFSVSATCPSTGGTYPVTATFYEDEDLTGCSATIQYEVAAKIPTSITISWIGNRYFQGYLRRSDTGAYLPYKPVKFTIRYTPDGRNWQTVTYDFTTTSQGSWQFECMFLWQWATITFEGDEVYASSTATITR